MEQIRVGIIGQGRSGRDIHGRSLVQDQRFKIVAVTDALADRRKRATEEYGCETYADYRKMLQRDDMDLVVNSSFSYQHPAITLDILKAGKNCLCEKPAARTTKEFDKMVAAQKKSGKVLAIYQNSRFAPYFMQVQKVLASGVLGRIVQINIAFNNFSRRYDWQTLQEYNGGNMANTGPHPIDQALRLFGEGYPEVFCHMDRANTAGDAEDHVTLTLRGEGHPLVQVEVSSCCAFPANLYTIYGTQGGLKGNTALLEWKYFIPKECPKVRLDKKPLKKPDGTPAYPSNTIPEWHTDKWEQPQDFEAMLAQMGGGYYDRLYRTLTTGAPMDVTLEQVRRQIWVMEKARKQNPTIYA